MLKVNVSPDIISGDFDSIDKELLEQSKTKGIEVIETPDQNFTDLMKGLDICEQRGAIDIAIVCSLGGERTDHSITNLGLLKKYT